MWTTGNDIAERWAIIHWPWRRAQVGEVPADAKGTKTDAVARRSVDPVSALPSSAMSAVHERFQHSPQRSMVAIEAALASSQVTSTRSTPTALAIARL